MEKFLMRYRKNVVLIDTFLRGTNQGVLEPIRPKSILGWFRHLWPIWYCSIWLGFYTYLIFAEGKKAGLELVSQQIWCMMCVAQLLAKLINGVLQVKKLQDLFKWCEQCYTMPYTDYEKVVLELYEQRDGYITICIRCMTTLLVVASFSYLFQPIVLRVRETPTMIAIDGNDYWPDHIFVLIYMGQFLHGVCVCFGLTAYDDIFILFTMTIGQRFRTMNVLLNLLNYEGERDHQKDRKVLVDLYKMHLSVLDATALFRSYYFFYGLVQLGTNLLANCSILYIIQTIGMDFRSFSVIVGSSLQVFAASNFGQLVQDEAGDYGDALYNTNWLEMSGENKKRLLLLMTGSERVVNIRAGGTYELNRALFAQVMKAGASLCAVMKAV